VGIGSWLRQWWQGVASRGRTAQLARQLKRAGVHHLLELGLSDLERTQTTLRQLVRAASAPVRYTAVDTFELRNGQPLPLRAAYARLKLPGVQVQLIPGPWLAALRRLRLSGVQVDGVVISHLVPEDRLKNKASVQMFDLNAPEFTTPLKDALWRERRDDQGGAQFVRLTLAGASPTRRAA